MAKANTEEEKPYIWHQVISKSDPLDSRGKTSKKSQQVRQDAPGAPSKYTRKNK